MKKVVLALAAVALVSCLSFSSCTKKCMCTNHAGVIELNIDELNEIIKDNGKTETIEKCTDMKVANYTCVEK